jgi:hypothetical protein
MGIDLCSQLLEDFVKNSWSSVEVIVERLRSLEEKKKSKSISLFRFKGNNKVEKTFESSKFFLRSSVEYSNPQLTLEEIQGIIGARMLETCGNYFHSNDLRKPDAKDLAEICEDLKKPSEGPIIAFLLNTDDIEADRYSMNPLKESIVTSGQSAFPVAYVKTEGLRIDRRFVNKYQGNLICKSEVELINRQLQNANGSYVDFVDLVKYAQMEELSEALGMHLALYARRMPIDTLQSETKDDLLHYIISDIHQDYNSIGQAYGYMRRSMTKRTTLLTVPHSKKGYGSKRAARGKLHFEGTKLKTVDVKYRTTLLYPNEIDPNDVSIAKAEDRFKVEGEKLSNYSFSKTPSSPQFFLYSLGSPEKAVLWHGIGAFAAPKLLRSYLAVRNSNGKRKLILDLHDKYGITTEIPLQFNLVPDCMWVHPTHRNIDASVGCVKKIETVIRKGMNLEYLSHLK